MSEEEMITILVDKYNEMRDEILFLDCLRMAGVDNWDGYDYAVDMYQEQGGGIDDE